MKYEWDDSKCEANRLKHGVDFSIALNFDWNKAIHEPDTRYDYAENRIVSFAPINGRIHAMVWVIREEQVRIIRLRKANKREVARYEAQT